MSTTSEPIAEMSEPNVLELARLDCELLALLTSARLRDPVAEQRRCMLLDGVNRAGQAAARRLEEYTRHAVTETHGSRSTWDVSADARAFFDGLSAYAALVRWSAGQLAALAEADAGARMAESEPNHATERRSRGGLRLR